LQDSARTLTSQPGSLLRYTVPVWCWRACSCSPGHPCSQLEGGRRCFRGQTTQIKGCFTVAKSSYKVHYALHTIWRWKMLTETDRQF
jgi:hypothetical protein